MALITYDEYLEHHGVKGMRWGVRRQATKLGQMLSNKTAKGHSGIEATGRNKLKKAGGNEGAAYVKVAAKATAIHFATNIGANVAISALKNNPSAQLAVSAGASAIKAANLGVALHDSVGIRKAANRRK
jgi:hypothetical protein